MAQSDVAADGLPQEIRDNSVTNSMVVLHSEESRLIGVHVPPSEGGGRGWLDTFAVGEREQENLLFQSRSRRMEEGYRICSVAFSTRAGDGWHAWLLWLHFVLRAYALHVWLSPRGP